MKQKILKDTRQYIPASKDQSQPQQPVCILQIMCLKSSRSRGIKSAELTLHVGAGTFQPVKAKNIYNHEMHCEHFFINTKTIELLLENHGKIIPVGTTSVRTLESLYWLGVKLIQNPSGTSPAFSLGQWEAYDMDTDISVKQSLEALLNYLNEKNLTYLEASTSIMIIPGYKFRMTNGMITNFHQPRSTLLLLISAWTGNRWKDIYTYALEKQFQIFKLWRQFPVIKITMLFINITIHFIKLLFL